MKYKKIEYFDSLKEAINKLESYKNENNKIMNEYFNLFVCRENKNLFSITGGLFEKSFSKNNMSGVSIRHKKNREDIKKNAIKSVIDMRNNGLSYEKIGKKFGFSKTVARDLYLKGLGQEV